MVFRKVIIFFVLFNFISLCSINAKSNESGLVIADKSNNVEKIASFETLVYAPSFSNCPSNITNVNPSSGDCTAAVFWTPPTASGTGTVTVVSNYSPGDQFFPGTHRVIYRATDDTGNTAFCTFTVQVNDNQSPIINVPADITTNVDSGNCTAVVTFPVVTVTDNCPAGTGQSPLEQDFTDTGGNPENFTAQCYQLTGTQVGSSGQINGSDELETQSLVNFDTRVFTMPLTRFNGTGEIYFDHRIIAGSPSGNIGSNARVTVSLVNTSNVATVIFSENYIDEDVQTEYIPITQSGNFYVRFEFDTDQNRDDIVYVDDIYVPGFVVADESGSGLCGGANIRVVKFDTSGLNRGSAFPVGTTTLRYFSEDAFGNFSFNQFNITVNNNINPPAGSNVEYCEGDSIPALTASVNSGETADWYDAPSGGNLLLADSATYTPPGPGTYYAQTRSTTTGCVSQSRTAISLIENPRPNPPASPSPIEYCVGDTATQLTATGDSGNGIKWYDAATGGSQINPAPTPDTSVAGTTTYYVQQTDSATGCTSLRTQVDVIVYDLPNAPLVTSPLEYCVADTADQLDDSATGMNLTWYDAPTGGNIIPGTFRPSTASPGTQNYWVSQTAGSGGINCEGPRSQLVVNVNTSPTINGDPVDETVCPESDASFTSTASNASALQWQEFTGGSWNDLSDVAPYSNTTTNTLNIAGVDSSLDGNQYRLVASSAAATCADAVSSPATLFVNTPPNVTANATDTEICVGESVTLTGSGASTYSWDNGVTDGTAFAPTTTTTYTVTGTDANGCENTDTITITVNPLPTVVANATDIEICSGDSVTLTGSGATSYSWDNGVTDGTAFATTTTTTYTVTGTDANGCQNTDTITITVNPTPTVVANATDTEICSGDSVTLTGSGATTYTWDNGVTDGTPFSPTTTTTYTVTGTDANGCQNTDTITITVNAIPTISSTSSATCSADLSTYSFTITTVGDNVITDVPAAIVANTGGNNWSITNIPAGTDIIVTATNTTTSCQADFAVNAPDCSCPVIAAPISGGDENYCSGDAIPSISASVNPGETVDWYNVSSNGTSIASNSTNYTPTSAGVYYAEARNITTNCVSSTRTAITVTENPIPTVVANATQTTICSGDSLTLTGSGANTYVWNNGVTDGTAFSPTTTTTYTVTGTDTNGCQNTDTITITVNPLPTVTANATQTTICEGEPITLTGSGASSYVWDNGVTNGVAFNPAGTNTYTVTGTDANGCQNTDTITINVNPRPTVIANATQTTICEGESVTLTGSGATSYTWNNGVTNGTPFTPTATQTYTVTGTDTNGCQNTDTITITVNPLPTVTANATQTTICSGDSVTLTGSGASTYVWNNGVTDGTAFIPTTTTTYTVTGTDTNGCQGTDTITITVNPLPTVTANASQTTICEGESVILTGSGASTYTWNNGVTDGTAFSPATTTTYTVTGTNTNGCENTDTITINVNPRPTVIANATQTTICEGESITLTGSGASTYTWDNGVTNGTSFVPTASLIYTVTGTDANGCQNTDSITITVNTNPTITSTGGATCSANLLTYSFTISTAGNSVTTNVPSATVTNTGGNNWSIDNIPAGTDITVTATNTGTSCTDTLLVNAPDCSCPTVNSPTIVQGDQAYCIGSTVPTMEVSVNTDETVNWFTQATGGTAVAVTSTLYQPNESDLTGGVNTFYAEATNTVTGCISASRTQIDITQNALPTVTANATQTTVCTGETITLTGSGATSYTWDNGITDGVAFTIASTTTYTVTGTDANGCQNTDTITITVNPLPTVTANATQTNICMGESVTLTGGGADAYAWDNAVTDGMAFIPTVTTTYTVTGTNINGCQNTETVTITVNPLPAVVANATTTTINAGEPVTLTGGGATTYLWDNGVTDGDTVFPLVTTTYTVIGTDANGCENTDSVTITVGATSDIRLEKTVDNANPNVGDTVTFTLTATNDGPNDDLGGSIVTDILPVGYTYTSDTGNIGNGTYNSATGEWTLPSLTNGTATTISISTTVNPPSGAIGEFNNSAQVTTASNFDSDSTPNNDDGDQSEDDEAAVFTVPQQSDIEITNTLSQPTANPGDTLTIFTDIINNGLNDATNISLENVVPAGFTVTNINDAGTQTGNTISWSGLNVPNGTTTTVSFEVTVNSPSGATNEYLNTVQITAADQFDADSTPNNDDGDQSEDDEDSVQFVLQSTDLEVINTVTPDSGNPGDLLIFTVDILNNGTDDATNVSIENVLPSGFTVVTINDGGLQTGNIISWTGLTIPNGTTTTLTFEVTINVPTNTPGEYFNTIQVISVDQLDPDSTPNNDDGDQSEDDEDNAEIVLIPADLSLNKSLSTTSNLTPNAGDTVIFELTVTNSGPGIATNVTIEDTLPIGYTLGTVNDSGTASGNIISWSIPSIPVGSQTVSYEVMVNAPTNAVDEYTNIAQITITDQFDPDSTPNNDDGDQSEDDEASYMINPPTVDINVAKMVDKAETFFEDTIVFTVTATNNSNYEATNIGIEDVLPQGYVLVSNTADFGIYNETTATWEIPSIPIDATATLQMTVTVTEIDDYTNVAELIYVDQIDLNIDNDRAEVTPVITQSECFTVFNEFTPNNDGLNDVFFIECIENYPNNNVKVFNRWGNQVFDMNSYDNSWDGTSMGTATSNAREKLPVGTYYYLIDFGDGSEPKTGWLYITR